MKDGWVSAREVFKKSAKRAIEIPNPDKNSIQGVIKVISLDDLEKIMEQLMNEG